MSKKLTFKPVDSNPNFPELERKLLDWWYKSGIVNKYLHKNNSQKKRFSFMDGPITANNPMGVHHAWGRTFKDLWQRYKNMRGFKQRFQNGFDCQGLWVEVEVEKELGFKSKKDIEKFGIAKFVELCRQRVLKYAKIQTQQSQRLGYFMDWDNSYYTISEENNYMIWHFLKKCWQNDWLYQGRDAVPWCPRCSTAISQHEMLTEDYKVVSHQSVYLKLPVTNQGWEDTYFLVWTTTPWTIPGNVALAVDPKIGYLVVKQEKEQLIISQARAKAVFPEFQVTKNNILKGDKLIGLNYQAPYDYLPRVKKALKNYEHRVVAADPLILPISAEEGTGIVHLNTGAGSEDYKMGKKEKLPVIETIDEQAYYLDGLDLLSGKNAKKHPEIILDYLKTKDNGRFIYRIESVKHRYPTCWRCKKELVWRVVDEWYISMDKKDPKDKKRRTLRQKMIEVAKKINWLPKFGLKRELDWLNNMQDWLISKKRYWGLALPIWQCPQGHLVVIGSKKELYQKAAAGLDQFKNKTPHRPWIDKIKISCPDCRQLMSRIPDVGNPWLDAGIVGFSTLIDPQTKKISYLDDQKYFKSWFPADFITESFPGQFKNWFYSMIAMSTVLEDEPPYKTVLGFATLLAEDGRPMHKSWGNAIEFNTGAEKIGADVMRWMYVSHDPKKNLLFGYQKADETRRRFHLLLWNVYKFFVLYASLDDWQPEKVKNLSDQPLDQWIIARLDQVILGVSHWLDRYQAQRTAVLIEEFVLDLSTWYVRRSRDRIGPSAKNDLSKITCYQVLYLVLTTLTRLLAPLNPFISEEIYKNLTGRISVHLDRWPDLPSKNKKAEKIIKDMELVRQICELGHSARKKALLKVRQPLALMEIIGTEARKSLENQAGLLNLIKDELNIKKVSLKPGTDLKVKLDTKLTPYLKKEGESRELIRQIQEARKQAGCLLNEQIRVVLPSWPVEFEREIKSQALVKELKTGKKLIVYRVK